MIKILLLSIVVLLAAITFSTVIAALRVAADKIFPKV
jgi:hypothetical protein